MREETFNENKTVYKASFPKIQNPSLPQLFHQWKETKMGKEAFNANKTVDTALRQTISVKQSVLSPMQET